MHPNAVQVPHYSLAAEFLSTVQRSLLPCGQ
jgi:hypothetical protein